jgi:hypothetical protein
MTLPCGFADRCSDPLCRQRVDVIGIPTWREPWDGSSPAPSGSHQQGSCAAPLLAASPRLDLHRPGRPRGSLHRHPLRSLTEPVQFAANVGIPMPEEIKSVCR